MVIQLLRYGPHFEMMIYFFPVFIRD
jgi:hypothetical protein